MSETKQSAAMRAAEKIKAILDSDDRDDAAELAFGGLNLLASIIDAEFGELVRLGEALEPLRDKLDILLTTEDLTDETLREASEELFPLLHDALLRHATEIARVRGEK